MGEPWADSQDGEVVWLVGVPEAERVRAQVANLTVYWGPSVPVIRREGARLLTKVPKVPAGHYLMLSDLDTRLVPGLLEINALRRDGVRVLDVDGEPWEPKAIILITPTS